MDEGTHTNVPLSHCPNCGSELDGAFSPLDNTKPKKGDITICMRCHHVMAFAEDMKLRDLTVEEMLKIAGDRDLIRYQAALAVVNARRR